MTQPKLARPAERGEPGYASGGRVYFDPITGDVAPSVTRVLSVIGEDFLPGYYAKLVAEYAVQNFDQVKYQSDTFGESVAIGALKSVPGRPNPAAAIGDEVHDAIDLHMKRGADGPFEFATPTAKHMFAQFTHFQALWPGRFLKSEFTVWSRQHQYAGTGDLLVEDEDGVGIVDTKTGNRIYPKVALQTAALANADYVLREDGSRTIMPHADWLGVLHVRPRSAKLYKLKWPKEAWGTFLAARAILQWKDDLAATHIPAEPSFEV